MHPIHIKDGDTIFRLGNLTQPKKLNTLGPCAFNMQTFWNGTLLGPLVCIQPRRARTRQSPINSREDEPSLKLFLNLHR